MLPGAWCCCPAFTVTRAAYSVCLEGGGCDAWSGAPCGGRGGALVILLGPAVGLASAAPGVVAGPRLAAARGVSGRWGKADGGRAPRGPGAVGSGFQRPGAISSDGTRVSVANTADSSVTELNAATGALVKVITGSSYQFIGPRDISSDGTHVWGGQW
jgi:hypothetical protein